jgi:hypothetical protein
MSSETPPWARVGNEPKFTARPEETYVEQEGHAEIVKACKKVVDRMPGYLMKKGQEQIFWDWNESRNKLIESLNESGVDMDVLTKSRAYHVLFGSTPSVGTIDSLDVAKSDEIIDFILNYEKRHGLAIPEPEQKPEQTVADQN